ncbi:hypothetical protein HN615_10185 [Candidatus Woesearchaeota archaeon]|jgi:hypothetical protein|nr:hypothetical protein [Candidatus Woesearchaeota archaeon]
MKYIIHPGYSKTATTTLQNNLIGKHSQILSLGRPWTDNTLAFVQQIKKHEGTDFSIERVKSALEKISIRRESGYRVAVISDETLHIDQSKVGLYADRLKTLFPNGEILLTIRNQVDAIESIYMYSGRILKNLPKPYNRRHVEIDAWLEWCWEHWDNSYFGLVDYHKYVEMYQKKFGLERVHILLFEDFVNNPDEYIEKLSNIFGIDSNEAKKCFFEKHDNLQDSTRSVNYLKFREYFFSGVDFRNIIPFGATLQQILESYIKMGKTAKKIKLSDKWQGRLKNKYKDGNIQLVNECGLELRKYGYPL